MIDEVRLVVLEELVVVDETAEDVVEEDAEVVVEEAVSPARSAEMDASVALSIGAPARSTKPARAASTASRTWCRR